MPFVVRRRGVGLLGATMVGAAGYAAGKSAGKGSAEEPQQAATATPQAPPPASPTSDEKIGQLQKLGELKQSGVLTEAEFEAQKARILAS